MSELDDFFANLPENQEDGVTVTPAHVELLLGTVESMFLAAMGDSNQISITLTRVVPEGPVVWSTVVRGTPITIDTLQELVGALSRLL